MNLREVEDVTVIGSGPAGCATALALNRAGVGRICLVEPESGPEARVGETLPPDVCVVLGELGLWEGFLTQNNESCPGSCSSWGDDRTGFNDFILSPHGQGWHIDRRRFDLFLLSSAIAGGETRHERGKLIGCARVNETHRLCLVNRSGEYTNIVTRFVVDATGSQSAFARRVGAKVGYLDRLTFVYGFFDASNSLSSSRLTMLEATECGWWYVAPVPKVRLAIAFATDPEVVRSNMLFREDQWVASLLRARHIAPRLEGCKFIRGSLMIRVVTSFLLDKVAGPGWLAVGDAAATYDPLSSQGIHKALDTGMKAARTLVSALVADKDASSDYEASIFSDFEEYRNNRNYFYEIERRWANSPFWRRRHERAELKWPMLNDGHLSRQGNARA